MKRDMFNGNTEKSTKVTETLIRIVYNHNIRLYTRSNRSLLDSGRIIVLDETTNRYLVVCSVRFKDRSMSNRRSYSMSAYTLVYLYIILRSSYYLPL